MFRDYSKLNHNNTRQVVVLIQLHFLKSVLSEICSSFYLITPVTLVIIYCAVHFPVVQFLFNELCSMFNVQHCYMTPRSRHYQVPTDFPEDDILSSLIFVLVYYCTLGRGDTLSSSMCDDTSRGSCMTSFQVQVPKFFFWLTGHNLNNVSPQNTFTSKTSWISFQNKRKLLQLLIY